MNDFMLAIALVSLLLVCVCVSRNINQRSERTRRKIIRTKMQDWGVPTCRTIWMKRMQVGFTAEQVELSWGEPDRIDQEEVTKDGLRKTRWLYGLTHGEDERYVDFTNDQVSTWKG